MCCQEKPSKMSCAAKYNPQERHIKVKVKVKVKYSPHESQVLFSINLQSNSVTAMGFSSKT